MRVLLASGDRPVADAIAAAFSADVVSPLALGSLTEPTAFTAVDELSPGAVVCVPSWSRDDLDEVRGCWWLARASDLAGTTLVVVSTAEVFDGGVRRPRTEFDRPEPTGPAGRAAAAVEQLVADSTRRAVIVRAGPLDVGQRSVEQLLADPDGVAGGAATLVTPVAATGVGLLVRELAVGGRWGVFHAAGVARSLGELAARLGVAAPAAGRRVAPPPLEAPKTRMVGASAVAAWPEDVA